MSGALNSVFKGGNIFGSLLSLASLAFPPLAIATSMNNLLTQAIGTAIKMAVDTLVKEFGMPKFLASPIKSLVDQTVAQNTSASDPAADAHVNANMGGQVEQWTNQTASELVQEVLAKMRLQGVQDLDSSGSSSSASRKKGAGSWLEAIAQVMGKALGEKAGKLVDLSNTIATNAGGQGKAAAAATTAATTEMQATGQMFSLMQNGFSTAIKSIGEGLAAMARKQ